MFDIYPHDGRLWQDDDFYNFDMEPEATKRFKFDIPVVKWNDVPGFID